MLLEKKKETLCNEPMCSVTRMGKRRNLYRHIAVIVRQCLSKKDHRDVSCISCEDVVSTDWLRIISIGELWH